jgi:predicted DNA-binding transcriptional regulator AlpA
MEETATPQKEGGKKKRRAERCFDPNRLLHDINSVAMAINKSARTVDRMVKDGRLPGPDYIDGRLRYWSRSLLHGWVKQKTGKDAA